MPDHDMHAKITKLAETNLTVQEVLQYAKEKDLEWEDTLSHCVLILAEENELFQQKLTKRLTDEPRFAWMPGAHEEMIADAWQRGLDNV